MKKLAITQQQLVGYVSDLCRNITISGWKPDYIVGLTRGGLIPAVMISHYLKVPLETLKVSLRDENKCEINCWMSEDAFGYVPESDRNLTMSRWDISKRKNILIVDDINDSGATLAWIKNDWQASCLPNEPSWSTVWGQNVRVAVIVNNLASSYTVDYSALEINKEADNVWIDFPWEYWWK